MAPSENQLFDFPDPVIAAYLERIQAVSEAAFGALNDRSPTPPIAWLYPSFHYYRFVAYSMAQLLRRASTAGCRDEAARQHYRWFWAFLAKRGWTAGGIARVAQGLVALRTRAQVQHAWQRYDKAIGAFVPPETIGWTPPAVKSREHR